MTGIELLTLTFLVNELAIPLADLVKKLAGSKPPGPSPLEVISEADVLGAIRSLQSENLVEIKDIGDGEKLIRANYDGVVKLEANRAGSVARSIP